MPDGIVTAEYCRDSGLVPTEACKTELRGNRTERGYFKAWAVPRESCARHIEGYYNVLLEQYGAGQCDLPGTMYFHVLSDPNRVVPDEVHPSDEEYFLEYLIANADSEERDGEQKEEQDEETREQSPPEPIGEEALPTCAPLPFSK
jgi:hypothetical protein